MQCITWPRFQMQPRQQKKRKKISLHSWDFFQSFVFYTVLLSAKMGRFRSKQSVLWYLEEMTLIKTLTCKFDNTIPTEPRTHRLNLAATWLWQRD